MPKVTEEHRERRRREILEAAQRSFARKGFYETSMNDIIEESGLSAGAIYGHYAGKSELIAAVAKEVFSPSRPELQPAFDDSGDPVHPLDYAERVSRVLIATVPGSVLPLQVWGKATHDENLRDAFVTVFGRLQAGIREQTVLWLTRVKGFDDTEADARAGILTTVTAGLLQGAVVQIAFVPGFDRGAYLAAARPIFDSVTPSAANPAAAGRA